MRFGLTILISAALWGQAPFKPNAQLGVPAQVGSIAAIIGTKERLEIGTLRELTLESAELALVFPNRMENVVAKAEEKLLILRGSLRNPEKKSTIHLGPSAVIGLRLWQKYTGAGKFAFVAHFDPETLKYINADLKGGDSAKFVGVWRLPADFNDWRLGVTSDRPEIIAWYDLTAAVKPLVSPFGASGSAKLPPGSTFEIDGIEIEAVGVSKPDRIGGWTMDRSKPFFVVTLKATNRMLMPVRWGWQYFTMELIGADGSATKAYPAVIDKATDGAWAGDLPAGASVISQFLFYPASQVAPGGLRMTMLETGRRAEITLGR